MLTRAGRILVMTAILLTAQNVAAGETPPDELDGFRHARCLNRAVAYGDHTQLGFARLSAAHVRIVHAATPTPD